MNKDPCMDCPDEDERCTLGEPCIEKAEWDINRLMKLYRGDSYFRGCD